MRLFLLPLVLIVWLVASVSAQTITPPQEIRQSNYGPSCAHAATITMLRWQGQPEMAAWWRQAHYGGETFTGLATKAIHAKLDYALLRRGDIGILDYATTTGRGAVIDWSGKRGGHHAVFFCGFDRGTASFVDPNTNRKHTFTRDAFLAYWRLCGGRSFMTLYSAPQH